jgi:hypothetical protein
MEAAPTSGTDHSTAVGWLAELLQVAVTSSNAEACRVLCSSQLCQHLSKQHVTNVLMLAVQMLHFKWYARSTQWHEQRLLVMQHLCGLFNSCIGSASSDASQADAATSRAYVRQVLACAVQCDAEDALRELLGLIPVQVQCLSYSDVYFLLLLSLRSSSSPSIMTMLCGLRLGQNCYETPDLRCVSLSKLRRLFDAALSADIGKPGVPEVFRLLATWEPCPACWAGSFAKSASHFSHSELKVLCDKAHAIVDDQERAQVLDVLCGFGSTCLV